MIYVSLEEVGGNSSMDRYHVLWDSRRNVSARASVGHLRGWIRENIAEMIEFGSRRSELHFKIIEPGSSLLSLGQNNEMACAD